MEEIVNETKKAHEKARAEIIKEQAYKRAAKKLGYSLEPNAKVEIKSGGAFVTIRAWVDDSDLEDEWEKGFKDFIH